MDFINKFTAGNDGNNNNSQDQNRLEGSQDQARYEGQGSSGGYGGSNNESGNSNNNEQQQSSGGGFMDKLNGLVGGGRESEKNEDYLDKGVDFVQEKFLGQGAQDNESAIEQAKDEKISDFIREQYKSRTGSDFPVADKETRLG